MNFRHKVPFSGRPYPSIYGEDFWSDAPLLRFPVIQDECWSTKFHDGEASRCIEAIGESVSVPAGRFEGCVRVKTTVRLRTASEGSDQADEVYNRRKTFREGEKWMWFAPGVGIIKAEHHHTNGKQTLVELVSHHLTEPSDSYFPLKPGNWWQYEWKSEDGALFFREQERVVLEEDGEFLIACSGYATHVTESSVSANHV